MRLREVRRRREQRDRVKDLVLAGALGHHGTWAERVGVVVDVVEATVEAEVVAVVVAAVEAAVEATV